MIDSKKVLYASGGGDEAYTPAYGVKPILKYIPKDAKVWCPFDKAESEFVKQISQTHSCLLYTSPSPRDAHESRMPSSA